MTVKNVIKVILGADYKKSADIDWELYHIMMFMIYTKFMSGLISVLCIPFLFLAYRQTIAPFIIMILIYAFCNIINRIYRW